MTDNDAIRRELDRFSDEKLADILRERDAEAWRPEVFDIVASILESRGVSTRELMASESEGSGPEDFELLTSSIPGLVTVAQYLDPLEAQADLITLEQAGLKAWVVGADQGTELRVQPGDLAAAERILEAPPVSAEDLPPEMGAPQCPRCGSFNVDEEAEEADLMGSESRSLVSSKRQIWVFRCGACKHTWSG